MKRRGGPALQKSVISNMRAKMSKTFIMLWVGLTVGTREPGSPSTVDSEEFEIVAAVEYVYCFVKSKADRVATKIQSLWRGFEERKKLFCDISEDPDFRFSNRPNRSCYPKDMPEVPAVILFDKILILLYDVIKETKLEFPKGICAFSSLPLMIRPVLDDTSFEFKHFQDIYGYISGDKIEQAQSLSLAKPKILEVAQLIVKNKSEGYEVMKEYMEEASRILRHYSEKYETVLEKSRNTLAQDLLSILLMIGETDQEQKSKVISDLNNKFSSNSQYLPDLKTPELILEKMKKYNIFRRPLKSDKFGLAGLKRYGKQFLVESESGAIFKKASVMKVYISKTHTGKDCIKCERMPDRFILRKPEK